MSWQRPVLNLMLRLTEKPQLARGAPEKLRRNFEFKARHLFRMPKGARVTGRSDKGLWVEGKGASRAKVIFYVHGGGFVFGSPRTHQAMLARLSEMTGAAAYLPFYRLAPEHVFPVAGEDVLAAYLSLLDAGISPENIVMGGDSAGGCLILSLLQHLLTASLPLPAATFAFSPVTDLTFSGESFRANTRADVVLPANRATEMTGMYLKDHDPNDPLVSPLFADFSGASPVWLTVGDTEILCDDTRRLAEAMAQVGVDVTCEVERDLPHVWPIFQGWLPEADQTLQQLAQWLNHHLKT